MEYNLGFGVFSINLSDKSIVCNEFVNNLNGVFSDKANMYVLMIQY